MDRPGPLGDNQPNIVWAQPVSLGNKKSEPRSNQPKSHMGGSTAIDLDESPDESATLANVEIQGTHTSFPDTTATLSTPKGCAVLI